MAVVRSRVPLVTLLHVQIHHTTIKRAPPRRPLPEQHSAGNVLARVAAEVFVALPAGARVALTAECGAREEAEGFLVLQKL